MGERKHKAEGGEKKDKAGQGNKAGTQAAHPILQLQQMVGNKAVTNMIQRQFKDDPGFKTWRARTKTDINTLKVQLNNLDTAHDSETNALEGAKGEWGKMKNTFEETKP